MENFSKLSIDITKKLNKKEKKQNGIFFTPKSIRDIVIKELLKHTDLQNKNILEPSCGGCDFIKDLNDNFSNTITGIEKNENIFNMISEEYNKYDNISIINDDFISHEFNEKYDIIIGNPPYFLLKPQQKKEYKLTSSFFKGKTNIFCVFIYKCMELLNDNGILSFVLPSSILNTLAYDDFRKYLNENYEILNILELENDDFLETKQGTIILMLKKIKKTNRNYTIKHKNYLLFSGRRMEIVDFYKNKSFMIDLDISVTTGNITWNNNKDLLRTEYNEENHLLFYDFNINNNNELVLHEETGEYKNKGQYININNEKYLTPPVILVERGRGTANFTFKMTKINEDFKYKKFYAENHLYVIKGEQELLNRIYEELNNEELQYFLKRNNPSKCMSKTIIMNFLPLSI